MRRNVSPGLQSPDAVCHASATLIRCSGRLFKRAAREANCVDRVYGPTNNTCRFLAWTRQESPIKSACQRRRPPEPREASENTTPVSVDEAPRRTFSRSNGRIGRLSTLLLHSSRGRSRARVSADMFNGFAEAPSTTALISRRESKCPRRKAATRHIAHCRAKAVLEAPSAMATLNSRRPANSLQPAASSNSRSGAPGLPHLNSERTGFILSER